MSGELWTFDRNGRNCQLVAGPEISRSRADLDRHALHAVAGDTNGLLCMVPSFSAADRRSRLDHGSLLFAARSGTQRARLAVLSVDASAVRADSARGQHDEVLPAQRPAGLLERAAVAEAAEVDRGEAQLVE